MSLRSKSTYVHFGGVGGISLPQNSALSGSSGWGMVSVDSNSLFAPNESPRELPADGAETFNVPARISQSHCAALLAPLGVEISMGICRSKLAAEELGSSGVTRDEGSGAEVPDGDGDREGGEPVLRRREDERPPEDKSFWGIDDDDGDIKSTVVTRDEEREEGKEGAG
ncbi:hypothetical protein K439DRAFT_1625399 [Ramaria rubella]|nr:hypothetical protein K439DRAFT_1625399 [Ramaria rubella]